jgi:hypothetical protein
MITILEKFCTELEMGGGWGNDHIKPVNHQQPRSFLSSVVMIIINPIVMPQKKLFYKSYIIKVI